MQRRYSDASTDDCFGRDHIGLARERVPFDSFSAGPLLACLCAPLVLADPQAVPAETATFMDSARTAAGSDGIELTVFGGNAAVPPAEFFGDIHASELVWFPDLVARRRVASGRTCHCAHPRSSALAGMVTRWRARLGLRPRCRAHRVQDLGQRCRKLSLSFIVLHRWLRAEEGFEAYLEGGWLATKASQYSADLPTLRLNVQRHPASGPIASSGRPIAHELLHVLGLADLYRVYGATPPERRNGSVLIRTEFGLMGLAAYSYIDEAGDSVTVLGHRLAVLAEHHVNSG